MAHMQNELSALKIKGRATVIWAGEPSIHVLLLSDECPIMEYFASSNLARQQLRDSDHHRRP